MRIWLLTSELPQEMAGGIARYVDNFARLLGAAGHEVTVIARTEHPCDKSIAPGVRLIGIAPRYAQLDAPNPGGLPDTHPAYPYNILAYWPALSYQMADEVLRLLRDLPLPDIIESQEYAALPYFLLQRKLTERTPLARIPILVHLHSPSFALAQVNQEPRYRFPDYWVGQMEKFCIAAADALVSPSHFLAQQIERALPCSLAIDTIPYPLLLPSEGNRSAAQLQHLVYVGRLELRKGVLQLVKACARLWVAGEDFRLTLIGGDVEFLPRETTVGAFLRQRYSRWIESGQLHLAGQLEQARVLEHMEQAWAVVIPSVWENFPNTCMEAMGVGQVVLASRAGGQAEMIDADGVHGFLFDWGTPGDFEDKLHTVLALDRDQHERIAQQAQTRIRVLCDPTDIVRRRLVHYEAVIARSEQRCEFPTWQPKRPSEKGGRGVIARSASDEAISERARTQDRDCFAESTLSPSTALRTGSVEVLAMTGCETSQMPSQPALTESEHSGLLSVIIPYYNLGDYVEETLASVLATRYASYEVVIVNDGSTDAKSLAVLQDITSRGLAHLRILNTENQGLASARNTGVAAATGQFLAFVDADDMIEPDFFPRAIDVLQRYTNVAFVYSWVRYVGEVNGLWPTWNAEFPYLLGHNLLTPLVVMRRSAFLQWARNKPEFEYNLEDFEGWIALLETGGRGVSLPHPLVRYRVRAGSMYRSSNRDQQLYLYDLLTQRHADAYREWGMELFNLQNANGPGYLWNHPAVATADVSSAYVAGLENERRKLYAEVQTLGKAWEDQQRFITSQRVYIAELEARCRELITVVSNNGTPAPLQSNGISLRDYELGGKLMNRLRTHWLARRVLHSPRLKEALKKALRG